MHITNLNNGLLLHIFAFAALEAHIPLQLTCHRFYNLAKDNQGLFKTWSIAKFPSHLDSSTPLPHDTDYKWLVKCLHNNTSHFGPSDSRKYGYYLNQDELRIRSIIRVSVHDGKTWTITRGIVKYSTIDSFYQVGMFCNGLLQGQGTFINRDITYQGQFNCGNYHGLGTLTCENGESYHGYFLNDKKNGLGTQKYEDGSCYVGQWHNDKRHGQGSYHWLCGSSYVGQFDHDDYDKLGTFTKCIDGQVTASYFGLWENGIPLDCDFGYLNYKCSECDTTSCLSCTRRLHDECMQTKQWSHLSNERLDCGHGKDAMTCD